MPVLCHASPAGPSASECARRARAFCGKTWGADYNGAMPRESMQYDIVIVGAGPAGLAAAIRAKQVSSDISVCVLEKGSEVGAHILSGAVMDPKALAELVPDFLEQGAPVESEVKEDYFLYLTKTRAIKSPVTPPPLKNHGYYIVSLNKLTAWLGEKCEEAGVNIFPEFPGAEVLYDEGDRVVGVRTGDKGIDKEGRRKSNFEPGVD